MPIDVGAHDEGSRTGAASGKLRLDVSHNRISGQQHNRIRRQMAWDAALVILNTASVESVVSSTIMPVLWRLHR